MSTRKQHFYERTLLRQNRILSTKHRLNFFLSFQVVSNSNHVFFHRISLFFSLIENFVNDNQFLIDFVISNSTNSIVNKFVNSIFQIIHVVNNFVNQNTNNSITQINSNFVNQKSISTNSTFRNQFDITINN